MDFKKILMDVAIVVVGVVIANMIVKKFGLESWENSDFNA